jgi:hypothetical protein
MTCAAHATLQFVMNVLLLNVLIASMTNSFSKITQVRAGAAACSTWLPCCQSTAN